jgi:hypothetical protein
MGPIGDQSLSYAQDRTLNESPAAKIPVHLLEAMEPLNYTLTAGRPFDFRAWRARLGEVAFCI